MQISKKGNVFTVDSSQKRESDNKILIDLGRSLERMLTMEQEEFVASLLRQDAVAGDLSPLFEEEGYHYLKDVHTDA